MLSSLYGGDVAREAIQGRPKLGARFSKDPPVTLVGLAIVPVPADVLTFALPVDYDLLLNLRLDMLVNLRETSPDVICL